MRRQDHEALRKCYNLYKGERCFIFGTGPSLLSEDSRLLEKLSSEVTIGCNYLLKIPWFPFVPTFYTAGEIDNLPAIESTIQSAEDRLRTITYRWFVSFICPTEFPNWSWIYRDPATNMQQGDFQGLKRPLEHVVSQTGGHLLAGPVPLACWLGFDTIYLLGCDNSRRGYAYAEDAPRLDRPDSVHRAMLTAKENIEAVGRKIVDLTTGGCLPLERKKLKEVV